MKILVLCPYPVGKAPSQRFRFEQFLDAVEVQLTVSPFWSSRGWHHLYLKKTSLFSGFAFLAGMLRRMGMAFRIGRFDKVLVHRESIPLGPPWLEWLVVKVWRKPLIFDFDDAIWIPDPFQKSRFPLDWLKWRGKVGHICKWATIVICGNRWLADYAQSQGSTVKVIPTIVDTVRRHKSIHQHLPGPVTIGWTGSHSTLPYLTSLLPVLQQLLDEGAMKLVIIADQDPNLTLPNYTFRKWRQQGEIEELLDFDIGLMPLDDSDWSKGKCGFKAIQYLALGIPAVASPTGVNPDIVVHGLHGFLCQTSEEWIEAIRSLAQKPELRSEMGASGRQFICDYYSKERWQSDFIQVLLEA